MYCAAAIASAGMFQSSTCSPCCSRDTRYALYSSTILRLYQLCHDQHRRTLLLRNLSSPPPGYFLHFAPCTIALYSALCVFASVKKAANSTSTSPYSIGRPVPTGFNATENDFSLSSPAQGTIQRSKSKVPPRKSVLDERNGNIFLSCIKIERNFIFDGRAQEYSG